MSNELVTATVRVVDYRGIIQSLTEDHSARKYWTPEKRQDLSFLMFQAIDGEPTGSDLTVDQEQWEALASDLQGVQGSISPPQWAAEIARCVILPQPDQ